MKVASLQRTKKYTFKTKLNKQKPQYYSVWYLLWGYINVRRVQALMKFLIKHDFVCKKLFLEFRAILTEESCSMNTSIAVLADATTVSFLSIVLNEFILVCTAL